MNLGMALIAVLVAPVDETHACPMHAGRVAQVDHAHHAATGLDNAGSRHRFQLTKDGGRIELEATDGSLATRERIRAHLRAVASAFAKGDFGLPARIHEQTPPGVALLRERKDRVRYAFAETPEGGRVRIATADAAALEAVHGFLRFQIADHGTGDSTEVTE